MQLEFFQRLLFGTQRPKVSAPVAAAASGPAAAVLEERARTLLKSVGSTLLAERVRVAWNPRMRSTAGTAFPGKSLVHLNPRLRAFGDEEVDRTLRHELAHLLAHARAGRRRIAPHGREWQQACVDLGLIEEKRCHTLPLPRRQLTVRHVYHCPACKLVLPRVRPLRRNSACLACCRRHNHGRYDERFRFKAVRSSSSTHSSR